MRSLTRCPLAEWPAEAWTPDGVEAIKPYQIIARVSLSARDVLEPGSRRFPAVLDTGLNHNFAIRREHLDRWTGLTLSHAKPVTVRKRPVPVALANVWVYRNVPGEVTPSDRPPLRLRVPEGIIVFPPDSENPARLPVLGLRALVRNDLTREVGLRTARWF